MTAAQGAADIIAGSGGLPPTVRQRIGSGRFAKQVLHGLKRLN